MHSRTVVEYVIIDTVVPVAVAPNGVPVVPGTPVYVPVMWGYVICGDDTPPKTERRHCCLLEDVRVVAPQSYKSN